MHVVAQVEYHAMLKLAMFLITNIIYMWARVEN